MGGSGGGSYCLYYDLLNEVSQEEKETVKQYVVFVTHFDKEGR